MARIVIGSYVMRFPLGGYLSWVIQWMLGFKRLGHEVFLFEKSGWHDACYDPRTDAMSDDCSYGVKTVNAFLARFGLSEHWCFVDTGNQYYGLTRQAVEKCFGSAALFLDMGAHGSWNYEAQHSGTRILVDGEPGFSQMKMENLKEDGADTSDYDAHYTVGMNVGTGASSAPTAERLWHPIVDPVVVDLFPVKSVDIEAPFTSIMSWQAHRPMKYKGLTFGQKDVEFAKFLSLPQLTKSSLEIAVAGKNVPFQELFENGWGVRNAHTVTMTFDSWKEYISASRGEFSVCKNIFVATNSGFFSDRSAVYLASGRPVVLQETGFSSHLPCGRGLFSARTVEEAAAAIEQINSDYPSHSRWARQIAEEYLDTKKVLGKLLDELGIQ
jgi:hypothetical protein